MASVNSSSQVKLVAHRCPSFCSQLYVSTSQSKCPGPHQALTRRDHPLPSPDPGQWGHRTSLESALDHCPQELLPFRTVGQHLCECRGPSERTRDREALKDYKATRQEEKQERRCLCQRRKVTNKATSEGPWERSWLLIFVVLFYQTILLSQCLAINTG